MKKTLCAVLAVVITAGAVCTAVMAQKNVAEDVPEKPDFSKSAVTLTEDEKEQLKQVLSKKFLEILGIKLESGEITEDVYSSVSEEVQNGNYFSFGGQRKPSQPGMMGKGHGRPSGEFDKAQKPEMTQEQLDEMKENIKTQLSELLESEEITEQEYAEYIEALENDDFSVLAELRKYNKREFNRRPDRTAPKNDEQTSETDAELTDGVAEFLAFRQNARTPIARGVIINNNGKMRVK